MRAQVIFLAAVFGVAHMGLKDAAPDTVVNLKPSTKVELDFSRFLQMVEAPKCDRAGSVYVRPVTGADDYLLAPIRQVTPEGRLGGTFRLTAAWQDPVAGRGIFVDGQGTVYQAAIATGGVYVVSFAKDGSVGSSTKLETGTYVDPWHLAVFESGRFFVSGEAGRNNRTPYTAVFEANGKLVRQIYEPEDAEARRKGELGDVEFTHNDDRGNSFVRRGDVTLGTDGNVYLLHGTSPALVYAISPSGDVVHKMQIATVESGNSFRSINSYAGRLAIGLARFGHIEVHVMTLNETPIGRYAMVSNEGDVLSAACYGSQGFTFVTAASGGSAYLLRAKP